MGLRIRGHFPECVAHYLNWLTILAASAGEHHDTLETARASVLCAARAQRGTAGNVWVYRHNTVLQADHNN